MGGSPLRRRTSREKTPRVSRSERVKCNTVLDICAEDDLTKYVIQAKHGRFAQVRSLNAELSMTDIRPLHKYCQNGDHYMARSFLETSISIVKGRPPPIQRTFYIIKDTSCVQVDDLEEGSNCTTYTLDCRCQGGSFYLANRAGFFIINSKDNTVMMTYSLTITPERPQALHEVFKDGLHYFATDDFFYVVKKHSLHGLVYHRARSLTSAGQEEIVPISESVTAFINQDGNQLLSIKGMLVTIIEPELSITHTLHAALRIWEL